MRFDIHGALDKDSGLITLFGIDVSFFFVGNLRMKPGEMWKFPKTLLY